MTHGVRRAAEMREVALTVDLLGLDGAMSRGAVAWQQRIGELGLARRRRRSLGLSRSRRPDSVGARFPRRDEMKICVAGAAGAFGIKHLDALAAIDGVEVVSVVGGKAADIEALAAKRAIPHADKSLDASAGALRGRGGHPVDADPDARRPGDRLPEGGQARAGRNPDGRQPRRQRGAGPDAAGDRPRRHGRPRAALQPQPSMDPQQDRRRRAEDPADGRADLFLPPHQPQRARPAAQLDRPSAVAPRLPHRRSLPIPDRRESPRKRSACRGRSIRRSASPWTCRSA